SLAAVALLNLSGENTRSAARVESRTMGAVVAENVAVESAIAPRLDDGETRGRVTQAGRTWVWIRTVAPTDDPDIQRVSVRVGDPEGQAAERTLFRARRS